MPTSRRIAITLALMLLVPACGDDADDPVSADDLDGRTFVADEIDGRELVAGTRITVAFADGSIGADAGCNRHGGSYELVDGELRTGPLRSTRMACAEPVMEQEQWLADLLRSNPRIDFDGDVLVLSGSDTTLRLAVER
jgi:heat shock protein HslJ